MLGLPLLCPKQQRGSAGIALSRPHGPLRACHLGDISPGQTRDDDKLDVAREDLETTQQAFRRTLDGLAPFVAEHGRPAAAVFSGDIAYQAGKSGFDAFRTSLNDAAGLLSTQRKHIIVVPGNHAVVWATPLRLARAPSVVGPEGRHQSSDRIDLFSGLWKGTSAIRATPTSTLIS